MVLDHSLTKIMLFAWFWTVGMLKHVICAVLVMPKAMLFARFCTIEMFQIVLFACFWAAGMHAIGPSNCQNHIIYVVFDRRDAENHILCVFSGHPNALFAWFWAAGV